MTIDKGIVSKRLDAPYCSGPSKTWLKSKNPLKRCAGSEKRIGLGPCPRPTVAL
jgi:hypothetical protein